MSVPEIKLVFDEPVQRKKAPKHLADYSPEERRELAKSLGLSAFRANQVATHYFTHLSNDRPFQGTPAESTNGLSVNGRSRSPRLAPV